VANSYIYRDNGAEVDPFWQTTVPPHEKQLTLDEKLNELKKSFHKNASKADFVSSNGNNFILGKIGTNNENTEYMIWKSQEVIKGNDIVEEIEELFTTNDEDEARAKFQELTGGTYNTEIKTQGTGIKTNLTDQPLIGESEVEQMKSESELIQEYLNFKAKNNFAKNAQKIDFVPDKDGKILVLGMIGKSQIDRDSKFRIWKTQNHWTNERVEYLTDEMDRKDAMLKFNEMTRNI